MEVDNSNLCFKELSVERCILDLVINSLNSKCTAIAVRFASKDRKVQIVDNGDGIPKEELSSLFDSCHTLDNNKLLSKTLARIGNLSESIIITSRTTGSSSSDETFVAVYSAIKGTKLIKGVHRPSVGTTITINNFKLQCWNLTSIKKNSSIAFIIAALALVHVKVSFSLRNDDENNVIVRIRRPHNPWSVLKYICGKHLINLKSTWYCLKSKAETRQDFVMYGYVGFTDGRRRNVRCLFYNHKPIFCPQNLQNVIIQIFKNICDNSNKYDVNQAFFLLYVYSSCCNVEETFEKIAIYMNMQSFDSNMLLELISDYLETIVVSSSANQAENTKVLETNLLQCEDMIKKRNSNEENVSLSQLSEWSNWSYHPANNEYVTSNSPEVVFSSTQREIHCINEKQTIRHYNFLPTTLYNLLPYKGAKILNQPFATGEYLNISSNDDSDLMEKVIKKTVFRREILNVKSCVSKTRSEVRLTEKSISSMTVLNQVNLEFIAAITIDNKNKLLLLIDQHAIHERIRYESLLEQYRVRKSYEYISVHLREPILINDLDRNTCRILFNNKKVLNQFGLHVRSWEGHGFLVTSVPKCFIKSEWTYHNEQVAVRVRKLLSEISSGLKESSGVALLPESINNCIASEACHGAIKFGDPLTKGDCQALVDSLKSTKAPTRCAHGRPSIVPILELTGLGIRFTKIQKKLNYASLFERGRTLESLKNATSSEQPH